MPNLFDDIAAESLSCCLFDTADLQSDAILRACSSLHRLLRNDGTLWLRCEDTRDAKGNIHGSPWRLAFALRESGWWLRQDIILVTEEDIPVQNANFLTPAHAFLFLFAKSARYRFNAAAIREKGVTRSAGSSQRNTTETHGVGRGNTGLNAAKERMRRELAETGSITRNRRSVWPHAGWQETCLAAAVEHGGKALMMQGGGKTSIISIP